MLTHFDRGDPMDFDLLPQSPTSPGNNITIHERGAARELSRGMGPNRDNKVRVARRLSISFITLFSCTIPAQPISPRLAKEPSLTSSWANFDLAV
jgi:hypothetical protein